MAPASAEPGPRPAKPAQVILMFQPEEIAAFLRRNFGGDVSSVSFIGAGMFSEAFAFRTAAGEFIIRLSGDDEDFRKDRYAAGHFAAPSVPIPEVVRLGRFDGDHHFAITRRCPGQTLDRLDEGTVRRIAPHLFRTLTAIHDVDVSGATGWGLLDTRGVGQFDSWPAYLRSFYNQKLAFEWEDLFRTTMLERGVVEAFSRAMAGLLPYCAREKYLVHGDFGFDNVVSDGRTITGVLDWAEARYGDFMYDVAYLDFWSKKVRFGDLFAAYCAGQGRPIPHFEERIVCYMLHIGLGSLVIAAAIEGERAYVRVRERTRSVLKPGRSSPTDWTQ